MLSQPGADAPGLSGVDGGVRLLPSGTDETDVFGVDDSHNGRSNSGGSSQHEQQTVSQCPSSEPVVPSYNSRRIVCVKIGTNCTI
jgi:hypothetical protein